MTSMGRGRTTMRILPADDVLVWGGVSVGHAHNNRLGLGGAEGFEGAAGKLTSSPDECHTILVDQLFPTYAKGW